MRETRSSRLRPVNSDGDAQLVLAVEVAVESGLGEAADHRDVVHGGPVASLHDEQLPRTVEDLAAQLLTMMPSHPIHGVPSIRPPGSFVCEGAPPTAREFKSIA
jgi:hypothetical protein